MESFSLPRYARAAGDCTTHLEATAGVPCARSAVQQGGCTAWLLLDELESRCWAIDWALDEQQLVGYGYAREDWTKAARRSGV